MTKSQIKAELRRSACEDFDPFFEVRWKAYKATREFRDQKDSLLCLSDNDCRTFFLLVAEAL